MMRLTVLPACLLMMCTGCDPSPAKIVYTTHTVAIRQMKFEPAELDIKKGDTILFINNDLFVHDITESSKKEWSSGALPNGQSWKLVPQETVDYYCSIHLVMKGKIVVR